MKQARVPTRRIRDPKEDLRLVVPAGPIKVRAPVKPTRVERDRTRYTRHPKHKGVAE